LDKNNFKSHDCPTLVRDGKRFGQFLTGIFLRRTFWVSDGEKDKLREEERREKGTEKEGDERERREVEREKKSKETERDERNRESK